MYLDAEAYQLPHLLALQAYARGLSLHHLPYQQPTYGQHAGGLLGRGMELQDIRAYQHGDDSRLVDWKVSARTGHLHTRVLAPERELSVRLWVDLSPSHLFAQAGNKVGMNVLTAALLAWTIRQQQDKLHVYLHQPQELQVLLHQASQVHFIHQLEALSQAAHQLTQVEAVDTQAWLRHLKYFAQQSRQGDVLVIISDFHACQQEESWTWLRLLSQSAWVVLVHVRDPLDAHAPQVEQVTQGKSYYKMTASLQHQWRHYFHQQGERLKALTQHPHCHYLALDTDADPWWQPLYAWLGPSRIN
ncbi:Protein of unknown function DUF58 [Allopseudospirillum japonicum]|uniref:DUF58 domain-containing protein n=1 Tax=Allopseudospirillum japonicum TaxID=64971 RepID=A0A1H6T939_9GAMM|nr:DUF58 domain-containing protein [Allopseudospirillum japonicum]SEI72745.1 Protein of unknown function DUF58 [Allopseudospirillum japonicum]